MTTHSHSELKERNSAKQKWQVLANAVNNQNTAVHGLNKTGKSSLKTFELFKFRPLENNGSMEQILYKTKIKTEVFSIFVSFPKKNCSLSAIVGYNNTGNIRVWPSEEVLTFYALTESSVFNGKRVLELGGGMTCLAGLMIAKYTAPAKVHLTDGNVSGVGNVRRILESNLDVIATCGVLDWSDVSQHGETKYDVIIAADCVFFKDVHADLVDTIWRLLDDRGLAIVMAPRRGNTLQDFVSVSRAKGFTCVEHYNYNEEVWRQHLNLKLSSFYDENKHYPILLELRPTMRLYHEVGVVAGDE